jgi:oxygen-independent coproporphyrinogen-3 oxidase
MFTERFRSHHDAEQSLTALLFQSGIAAVHIGGRGKPKGNLRKFLEMKRWSAVEAQLKESPSGKIRGIYIHVPHCDRICSFCNLNRKERKGADLDAYTGFIADEIKSYGAYPYIREQPFNAVYFGGGTPTVLSTEQLSRILEAIHSCIPLAEDCEITLESTQHNLGAQKAAALADMGVNRFSIGIQTFSDRGREILGRTYDGERALEELHALRAAFKGTLGIDIIYSYPDQSIEEISRDAEICASSGVDSVSFYSLMIHQGSAMANSIDNGIVRFTRNIEWDKERHKLFYNSLIGSGFELLELSKLARPGRDAYRYIHIQYENGDLVPIGSGAGGRIGSFQIYSMAPGRRFVSPRNEEYDKYYRLLGELQFGLYDPSRMARFLGPAVEQAIVEKIQELSGRGLLVPLPQSSAWSLSPEGVFWGNNIAVEVLKAAVTAKGETVNV